MTAGSAQAPPGQRSVPVSVTLAVGSGEEVSAARFTVTFEDDALSLPDVALGSAAAAAGKTINTSQDGPGSTQVLVAGLNQTPISDGVLAVAHFDVESNALAGDYDISLEAVSLSDPFGSPVPGDAVDGVLEVTDSEGEEEGEPEGEAPVGGCQCAKSQTWWPDAKRFFGDLFLAGVVLVVLCSQHSRLRLH